eukprot:1836108-Alexandrium_andersonii.AAC.1
MPPFSQGHPHPAEPAPAAACRAGQGMAGRHVLLLGHGATKLRSSAAGLYLLHFQIVSTLVLYFTEVLRRGRA